MPYTFVLDFEIPSCDAAGLAEENFAISVVFDSFSNATVASRPQAGMFNQDRLYFSSFTRCFVLRRKCRHFCAVAVHDRVLPRAHVTRIAAEGVVFDLLRHVVRLQPSASFLGSSRTNVQCLLAGFFGESCRRAELERKCPWLAVILVATVRVSFLGLALVLPCISGAGRNSRPKSVECMNCKQRCSDIGEHVCIFVSRMAAIGKVCNSCVYLPFRNFLNIPCVFSNLHMLQLTFAS